MAATLPPDMHVIQTAVMTNSICPEDCAPPSNGLTITLHLKPGDVVIRFNCCSYPVFVHAMSLEERRCGRADITDVARRCPLGCNIRDSTVQRLPESLVYPSKGTLAWDPIHSEDPEPKVIGWRNLHVQVAPESDPSVHERSVIYDRNTGNRLCVSPGECTLDSVKYGDIEPQPPCLPMRFQFCEENFMKGHRSLPELSLPEGELSSTARRVLRWSATCTDVRTEAGDYLKVQLHDDHLHGPSPERKQTSHDLRLYLNTYFADPSNILHSSGTFPITELDTANLSAAQLMNGWRITGRRSRWFGITLEAARILKSTKGPKASLDHEIPILTPEEKAQGWYVAEIDAKDFGGLSHSEAERWEQFVCEVGVMEPWKLPYYAKRYGVPFGLHDK